MSDYDRGVWDYLAHLPAKDGQSDEYYAGYSYAYQDGEISTARTVGR